MKDIKWVTVIKWSIWTFCVYYLIDKRVWEYF